MTNGGFSVIIDFHTHLFPKTVRENRAAFFPDEPAFQCLYAPPRAKLSGAKELIAAMDAQGIDRAVAFGFPWRRIETARMHNDYILEAAARYPTRLTGFCCVDPTHPEAADEVARCLKAGLKGVGELAVYDRDFTPSLISAFEPVMTLCREADLPVLIHTNEPVGAAYPGKSPMTLRNLYRFIQAFPDNKLVLAHWGGGLFFFHLMKREVKAALAHVYIDTAASPYLYDPGIYRIAAEILGPDRILFGSDFPLIPPTRYLSEINTCGLSEPDRHRILGKNAERLLKLA